MRTLSVSGFSSVGLVFLLTRSLFGSKTSATVAGVQAAENKTLVTMKAEQQDAGRAGSFSNILMEAAAWMHVNMLRINK